MRNKTLYHLHKPRATYFNRIQPPNSGIPLEVWERERKNRWNMGRGRRGWLWSYMAARGRGVLRCCGHTEASVVRPPCRTLHTEPPRVWRPSRDAASLHTTVPCGQSRKGRFIDLRSFQQHIIDLYETSLERHYLIWSSQGNFLCSVVSHLVVLHICIRQE